jgi:hypothetical protein
VRHVVFRAEGHGRIEAEQRRNDDLHKADVYQAKSYEEQAANRVIRSCHRVTGEEDHDDPGGDKADAGEPPRAEDRDTQDRKCR